MSIEKLFVVSLYTKNYMPFVNEMKGQVVVFQMSQLRPSLINDPSFCNVTSVSHLASGAFFILFKKKKECEKITIKLLKFKK